MHSYLTITLAYFTSIIQTTYPSLCSCCYKNVQLLFNSKLYKNKTFYRVNSLTFKLPVWFGREKLFFYFDIENNINLMSLQIIREKANIEYGKFVWNMCQLTVSRAEDADNVIPESFSNDIAFRLLKNWHISVIRFEKHRFDVIKIAFLSLKYI